MSVNNRKIKDYFLFGRWDNILLEIEGSFPLDGEASALQAIAMVQKEDISSLSLLRKLKRNHALKLLVSACYRNLSESHFILGNETKAKDCLINAAKVYCPEADSELIAELNISEFKARSTQAIQNEENATLYSTQWQKGILTRSKLVHLADNANSDKGFRKHLYTTVYEEFVKPGKVQTLLEIGLLCHDDQAAIGGDSFTQAPSLTMWANYLPNAEIYGFDIQDFSQAVGPWQHIFRGDQSKRVDLQQVHDLNLSFDVIIDDALHASEHQQVTFSYLFEKVKSGGIFIIEDLHYQPFKEEGIIKTLPLLKKLASEGVWDSEFAMPAEKAYIEQNVGKVLFFDSMKHPRSSGIDAICLIFKK